MDTSTVETGRPKPDAHHFRFHARYAHLASVFGDDTFAVKAESFARFFGTPMYLIAQTGVVAWIRGLATVLSQRRSCPLIAHSARKMLPMSPE